MTASGRRSVPRPLPHAHPRTRAPAHPRTRAPAHYRPTQYEAFTRNTFSGRAANRFP